MRLDSTELASGTQRTLHWVLTSYFSDDHLTHQSRRFGYSDQLLIYTLGVLIRQYRSLNQAWLFASDTPVRQSHIVYTLPLRYSASDTQSWIFKLISWLLTQPHGSQLLLTYSRGLLSALRRSPFSYVASDNKAQPPRTNIYMSS